MAVTRGRKIFVGTCAAFVALQPLPFGHPRSNPPAANPLVWPSPETEDLFMRACGDCHSNETVWPWYSHVAPAKWIVTGHVRHGRGTFNVSAWDPGRFGEAASSSVESIRDGSMPPANYLGAHAAARLTANEKHRLIEGLNLMREFGGR